MYFHPKIRYGNREEDRSDSFIKYIANRVFNNNQNFLCAVTGTTGKGKSWLCGSIGEKYAKMTGVNYDPKIHTFFSLKELIVLVNKKKTDDVVKDCSFLHFDEPQVSANARDWQSEANKVMNTLVSTFRNQRLVVFFSLPYLSFLDKQTRMLFHAEIKVNGFNKKTELTSCMPRLLEWIPKIEDHYRKRLIIEYPSVTGKTFDWYFLQNWEVIKPSVDWIKAYEEKKLIFTTKLNRELQERMEREEKRNNSFNKADDFLRVVELNKIYDGDYAKILSEMRHLSPFVLQKYLKLLKNPEKPPL